MAHGWVGGGTGLQTLTTFQIPKSRNQTRYFPCHTVQLYLSHSHFNFGSWPPARPFCFHRSSWPTAMAMPAGNGHGFLARLQISRCHIGRRDCLLQVAYAKYTNDKDMPLIDFAWFCQPASQGMVPRQEPQVSDWQLQGLPGKHLRMATGRTDHPITKGHAQRSTKNPRNKPCKGPHRTAISIAENCHHPCSSSNTRFSEAASRSTESCLGVFKCWIGCAAPVAWTVA